MRRAEPQRVNHQLQRKSLHEQRAEGPPTCSLIRARGYLQGCASPPFLEPGKQLLRSFFMLCQVNQVSLLPLSDIIGFVSGGGHSKPQGWGGPGEGHTEHGILKELLLKPCPLVHDHLGMLYLRIVNACKAR